MAVILGSPYADTLQGTDGDDRIVGVGYDQMVGGGPPDYVPGIAIPELARSDGPDALSGGAGGDTLEGSFGDDTLDGGAGRDVLNGGHGADLLVGGPGADTFMFGFSGLAPRAVPLMIGSTPMLLDTGGDVIADFEKGLDRIDLRGLENPNDPGGVWIGTAPLAGSTKLQVGVRYEGGDTIVLLATPKLPAGADLSHGAFMGWNGSFTLRGRFDLAASDFAFTSRPFVDEAEGRVYRLYNAVFDRLPDAGGLEFWTGHARAGLDVWTMADQFVKAPEFGLLYGDPDNGAFVAQLYRNVLEREADAPGLSFWISLLDGAVVPRSAIVVGFSESEENRARVPDADYLA